MISLVLLLLISGLALVLWTTTFPHGLALLVSAAVVSFAWILQNHARERRTRVLKRSISSVDCVEEAYDSLIQILNKERVSYDVRGKGTIDLVSPICGKIELRRSYHDSYSNTNIDDPGTSSEFAYDLHETKYDVFRRERPTGTTITARAQSRKDFEDIANIVLAVIESLHLKAD